MVATEDASGRMGRSITNALGQLIRVDEPTATGGTVDADLGTLVAPNQPTIYTYSPQGKMVRVQQGVQNRYFLYDSLGRLLRVRQPEQEINQSLDMADAFNTEGDWTAGFAYDVLGNVVRATDANGVNIINEYDKANRVTKRCYTKPNISTTATTCAGIGAPNLSTDTPTVEFYYDGKGLAQQQTPHNFAKGKLTKVTSSVSETQYQLFDNFGRLTQSSQITDGQTYTSSYQYNLSGALIQETYPSGRVVKNEFESDGDLSQVLSRRANDTFRNYVNSFSYTASGGISQMRLGNGKWETAKFNERLQVTELGLGSSATNATLWKVNYTYGEFDNSWNFHANKNTGNIAKQTITIPGATFVQNYRYDSLYRLKDAVEPGAGSMPNWTQTFDYDRYGNRTAFTQTVGGVTTHDSTPAISNGLNGTNRFTSSNFEYDKNGNLVGDIDPLTSQARDFLFNADNKQREVIVNGASVGSYFYDGEGKRVKKVVGNETTVFVYSSGKLISEYSTTAPPAVGSINYTTTDHLGSPRIITNELGQVQSRRDFMPFGEDLNAGVGNRTSGQKYSDPSDQVRQKFTGYLKDNETGLDFAEARMYENRHGRFTAVDPLLASGKSANPQTFNRYVYVGNNPVVFSDPTGLDWYFKDGVYRYSSDNKTFDRLLLSPGTWIDPGEVDGSWSRVQLDENGEHRYSVVTGPGVSTEVILTNSSSWTWGLSTVFDPVARQEHIQKKIDTANFFLDMIRSRNEDQAMNDALRPLTDPRSGSSPVAPGRLGVVYDKMQTVDGRPKIGTNAFSLRARPQDMKLDSSGNAIPGNGMSVTQNVQKMIPFKLNDSKSVLFALPTGSMDRRLGIGMDPADSNHLFIQPARPMPQQQFRDLLTGTRQLWVPMYELPGQK